MLRKISYFLPILFFKISFAQAICPVCTVVVGAGIGLSRWLGIDDSITGVWIGALLISVSLWTINWISSKEWRFKGYKTAVFAFYVSLIIIPLFWMDVLFHPLNQIWGIDKLVIGIIIGILFFILSYKIHFYLKKKNNDKVYFPFQKVALTVGAMIILSLLFYFITG